MCVWESLWEQNEGSGAITVYCWVRKGSRDSALFDLLSRLFSTQLTLSLILLHDNLLLSLPTILSIIILIVDLRACTWLCISYFFPWKKSPSLRIFPLYLYIGFFLSEAIILKQSSYPETRNKTNMADHFSSWEHNCSKTEFQNKLMETDEQQQHLMYVVIFVIYFVL